MFSPTAKNDPFLATRPGRPARPPGPPAIDPRGRYDLWDKCSKWGESRTRRWGPRPRGEAPLLRSSHPVWAEGPGPDGRPNLEKIFKIFEDLKILKTSKIDCGSIPHRSAVIPGTWDAS